MTDRVTQEDADTFLDDVTEFLQAWADEGYPLARMSDEATLAMWEACQRPTARTTEDEL